jgi:hypothetical protein
MQARVLSIDPEEGGLLVLQVGDRSINAMNCLGYGHRTNPCVGDAVEVEFSFLPADDQDWNTFFSGNPGCEQRLDRTGLWSYRALGRLVAVESEGHEEATVDCGVCYLPAPIQVSDDRCIGSYVGFTITRLDAWHKPAA